MGKSLQKFNLIRIFLFCLLTLTGSQLWSQNKFAGRLVDKVSKQALIGASVYDVLNELNNTTTDESGIFYIQNPVYPLQLRFSYIGYSELEIEYASAPAEPQVIGLEEAGQLLEGIVIKGQRISDKQKADPRSVESMDLAAIKETPSISFYSGLGNLKGVDLTTASLGFTIINTRGFNSTSPVRSLQLIDGVDNQAPGLNFSLGNFLGVSELDILKVDLIAGANSTLYGPNAFNGVINMETKSPFFHQGLSASLKLGERNLLEAAIRWADVLKNKNGQDVFGYKLNLFHLQANDWEADNYNAVDSTQLSQDNLGGYDAVNIYGDEYRAIFSNEPSNLNTYKGLESWSRRGYKESDLVDYNTKNSKANVAFYLKTAPSKGLESPELQFSSNFGTGTTVYQGDNRFRLKNILFFQNRLEYVKKDKYFIRAYATHEDAGDSYDPYFTALQLQSEARTDADWYNRFITYWQQTNNGKAIESGYPPYEIYDSVFLGGFWNYKRRIDPEKFETWKSANADDITQWYNDAKNYADSIISPISNGVRFYEPGTERFNEKFNSIISQASNDRGTKTGSRFYDKSALYHLQGEYKFKPAFGIVTVGGSGRLYLPNSAGTIFRDTGNVSISTYEYGFYSGLEKKFANDKFTVNIAARADKNKNFNLLFSPAASLVWNPSPNNFFRLSFSSAIRNPTLTDQYLNLDVGPATLVGNLYGVDSVITVESFKNYLDTLNPRVLRYFDIDAIKPEKVKSLELGVRTTLFEKIYVDASYYFSVYDDFIGYNIGVKADFDEVTGLINDFNAYRYSANSTNRVTTQGFNIGLNYYFATYYMIAGNYSWNRLNKTFADDPIIPAFNTPEHKYNISLSARDLTLNLGSKKLENIGFNVTYKWIQGFIFEGSPQFTGFIPTYDMVDAQVSVGVDRWNTTIKVGASNILNNKVYQTYGGPKVGRMGYLSLVYNLNTKS